MIPIIPIAIGLELLKRRNDADAPSPAGELRAALDAAGDAARGVVENSDALVQNIRDRLADPNRYRLGPAQEATPPTKVSSAGQQLGIVAVNVPAASSSPVRLADPPLKGRRVVLVQNLGADPVYVSTDGKPSSGNGVTIPANGGEFTFPVADTVELWAVADNLQVSPANTRVLQS